MKQEQMKYITKIERFLMFQILTEELKKHAEGSMTYNLIIKILDKIK
jgi:hypothetical protein